MANIAERRTEAAAKLDMLRRERGAAVLDGIEFDASAITAAESEIDALDAAEAEETRRIRESAAMARREQRAAQREKLAVVADQRLDAIRQAEAACKVLADALGAVVARSSDAAALIRSLGFIVPSTLSEADVTLRASIRIAAAMRALTGYRRKFGAITFPEAAGPLLSDGSFLFDPWTEAEIKKTGAAIERALNEEI